MRKAAVLLLSTAAVMMIVGMLVSQSLLVLQRVAAVEGVQGMVYVQQHGEGRFQPLADRARVGAGDVLKTGERGQVDLRWVDDTQMRVGPNSQVTVLKSHYNSARKADTQVFKLDLGRVWIRILKVLSQKSKFEVITPTATAGVRGTIFSVAVTPDGQTTVSVKEGKVAVAEEQGARELTEGQMLQGGQAETMGADEKAAWTANEAVALPHLEIKAPVAGPDGVHAAPGPLTVSGVAEQGATVTVNGQPQQLRLGKLFDAVVTVPPASSAAAAEPFRIVVEVKDRRGYVSREVIEVKPK